jgi:hypothetical protein
LRDKAQVQYIRGALRLIKSHFSAWLSAVLRMFWTSSRVAHEWRRSWKRRRGRPAEARRALEPLGYVGAVEGRAGPGREDEPVLLPLLARQETLLELLLTLSAEGGDHRGWQVERAAAERGLGRHELPVAVEPLQLVSEVQSRLLQVDVLPAETQRLPLPESERQGQDV